MITLIIGLIITIGGVYGAFITFNLAFLLLYVLGLGMIVVPLLLPFAGWDSGKCLNQYELVPFKAGFEFYVVEDGDGNLIYKHKNENGEEVTKRSTFADTNYDNEDIKSEPILKVLLLKPKKNLWCLPIFCPKKEQYIIKLPKDKFETAILK